MKEYKIEKCSVDAFIKFIVGRRHGNCTDLILPNECTEEVVKYVADACPALRALLLPSYIHYEPSIIPTLIGKWKHLENLSLEGPGSFVNIITQVSLCCKKFSGLRVLSAWIWEKDASAIVTNLPNIKYLVLSRAKIDFESLVIILEGCKNLVYLDVSDCLGFNPDEKVLELASHIKTFKCEGSKLTDFSDFNPESLMLIDYNYYDDEYDYEDSIGYEV